jgi:predicted PurR-regulated permease PerM
VADTPRALILWTIGMIAVAVAVVAALYLARDALVLVYVSSLLATGFSPLVRAIEHQHVVPVGTRRLPRWLAILVVYVAIVGVIVAIAVMIIPPLVDQAQQLWRELPSLVDRAQTWLMQRGWTSHRVTLREAVQRAPGSPGSAVGTVATAVSTLASRVLGAITVLILTFYLLVDSDTVFAGFARLFPRDRRPRVVRISREITDKISAWLSGQLILAGTIGGSSAIGLYLIGVPYFYVLGLVSAIGEMIPVVGPILAAIPATAAAFTVSPRTALYVIVFFIAQQQAENHLLVPKIMERQVGVSPVVVIVALLIGGSLLGILGAVLAVPTAAILQVIVQELLDERDRIADTPRADDQV